MSSAVDCEPKNMRGKPANLDEGVDLSLENKGRITIANMKKIASQTSFLLCCSDCTHIKQLCCLKRSKSAWITFPLRNLPPSSHSLIISKQMGNNTTFTTLQCSYSGRKRVHREIVECELYKSGYWGQEVNRNRRRTLHFIEGTIKGTKWIQ